MKSMTKIFMNGRLYRHIFFLGNISLKNPKATCCENTNCADTNINFRELLAELQSTKQKLTPLKRNCVQVLELKSETGVSFGSL